jgi:two-component system, OmpR family, response regulator
MPGPFRILHVDDDALMRELVELALGLDAAFVVLGVASAQEALDVVIDWAPDLILCDVLLPDMDGPALLARLRQDPATAKFPVVFMTARAQVDAFRQTDVPGAVAVIAKPFEPAKLAETVRRHLQTIRLQAAGFDFAQRLHRDAATLLAFRRQLQRDHALPEELQMFVHKLAGAAGIFNFGAVSAKAAQLESAIIENRAGRIASPAVAYQLDALLETMDQA